MLASVWTPMHVGVRSWDAGQGGTCQPASSPVPPPPCASSPAPRLHSHTHGQTHEQGWDRMQKPMTECKFRRQACRTSRAPASSSCSLTERAPCRRRRRRRRCPWRLLRLSRRHRLHHCCPPFVSSMCTCTHTRGGGRRGGWGRTCGRVGEGTGGSGATEHAPVHSATEHGPVHRTDS